MKDDLRSVKRHVAKAMGSALKERQFSSILTPEGMGSFQAIQSKAFYPKGSTLFLEGKPPAGVFVLWKGKAALSVLNHKGRQVLLRTTHPREILGLSAAVSGEPYEATAQAVAPCHVSFIAREDFLDFLRNHVEAAFRVVKLLSDHVSATSEQIRRLGGSGARRRNGPRGRVWLRRSIP